MSAVTKGDQVKSGPKESGWTTMIFVTTRVVDGRCEVILAAISALAAIKYIAALERKEEPRICEQQACRWGMIGRRRTFRWIILIV